MIAFCPPSLPAISSSHSRCPPSNAMAHLPRPDLRASKQTVPQAFDQVASHYDLLQWLNPGYRFNLRQSRAFEDRLRRAGFVDVRTEPLPGWSRGIVHSFLARRPR